MKFSIISYNLQFISDTCETMACSNPALFSAYIQDLGGLEKLAVAPNFATTQTMPTASFSYLYSSRAGQSTPQLKRRV
jgi:hypothetical protein